MIQGRLSVVSMVTCMYYVHRASGYVFVQLATVVQLATPGVKIKYARTNSKGEGLACASLQWRGPVVRRNPISPSALRMWKDTITSPTMTMRLRAMIGNTGRSYIGLIWEPQGVET